MADRPIKFEQVLDVSQMGVIPANIKFDTVTMESDRFLCFREKEGQPQPQVAVIDLSTRSLMMRRAISADATIMHPSSNVLALRSGAVLQIFNLDLKSKMKTHQMTEQINFWKWINTKTIAIVTAGSVYHWSLDGDSAPVKVFDKLPQLNGASVLNYRTDKAGKWLLINAVTAQGGMPQGVMQLYSVEKGASQFVEGFTACFTEFQGSTLLCFANKNAGGCKLTIIPVGGGAYPKKVVDIQMPPDAAQDFPFTMQVNDEQGIIYIVTKMGYIFLYDVESAAHMYVNRISSEPIFLTALHESSKGIIGINRKGQVLLVSLDPEKVVPFCTSTLGNFELGIRLASRCGFPGAESLFEKQFNALMTQGNYQGAAQLAAQSPQGALRNNETLQRFKQLPHVPPNPPPLLQYFHAVMDKTKLNKLESLELARIVVGQGKHQLIDKWIKEDKIECSEELGDLVASVDASLSLNVYLRAEASDKVVQAFVQMRQYEKILKYCKHVGYTPDYFFLLQNIVALDPAGAEAFAKELANQEGGTLLEWGRIADVFISRNMIKEATAFLLDALKGNNPEDADLQTRLLEINLHTNPQVANYILEQDMFSHYNRAKIAQLCERAGLFQRALEHYTELNDFKRCIVNTQAIQPEFLVDFFKDLEPQDGISCLRELLKANQQANMQVTVQIATKYSDQYGSETLMKMFEEFGAWKGLFYYLGAICIMSQDPEVHFKYIEAAVKCGQLKEVERHTRESDFYDSRRAADFLMEMKLPDQRPLINVCDRYDMVDELTKYLFSVNQTRVLEVYCKQVNPLKTPVVVGSLLDVGCDEKWLVETLMEVGNMCPAEDLVREVEERGRLKLIMPWLEARQSEQSTESSVYNALAKIYVDNNNNPERFLEENDYYDSVVVGKYCEKRDPILAYIAYKKNSCDTELLEVTNKNGLFKQQAAYLVDRSDEELWATVLVQENPNMRQVIDQVVGVALPACTDANKVGCTVKAFMTAELPHELIELLEKIVLHGSNPSFATNENLQNLLILTAVKADQSRVMGYVDRLNHYHGMEIANIAVDSELFEEALAIFMKFNYHEDAARVMVDHLHDIDRTEEYAEKVDDPAVWSLLAKAQLVATPPLVAKAINSYIKAKNPNDFALVAQVAEREGAWSDLIQFLQMARKGLKEVFIDNTLVYAFAKAEKLAEMEEFINAQNSAKLKHVGDRCFDEELFRAAKILFDHIPNYGRLATALVKLEEYGAAVDAARKAKVDSVWKEVMVACVDVEEFRLAQICGMNVIVSPDDLEVVVETYEVRGRFTELMALLEAGTHLDRAHMGIFTELGILLAKHKPAKLMGHLESYKLRLNIRKLQRTCEQHRLWPELAFLYTAADEYDSAVVCMMEHESAWDHAKFKDNLNKVSNTEYLYRSLNHYLSQQPLLLVDLLMSTKARLDHPRVVADVSHRGHLPLIREYLEDVQHTNLKAVNNALNNMYVEEEEIEKLRESIDNYDNFDQIGLAQELEKLELLEYRRVAAYIYKKNSRWSQSIELSKQDKLYKDAMETTADSKDQELAEELLRFFVEIESKECFAACLYRCFELIRSDVVLELAWRFDLMNLAMPFMVQTMRSLSERVEKLESTKEELVTKVEEGQQANAAAQVAAQGTVVDNSMQGTVYYDQQLADQYTTMLASQDQTPQFQSMNYYGQ